MRSLLGLVAAVLAALFLAAACGGDERVDPEDLVRAGFDLVLKVRLADLLEDPDVDAIYREVAKDEDAPKTLGELLDRFEESIGILRQMDEVVVFGALSDLSVPLILYGIVAQQMDVGEPFTIVELFIAGIMPVILMLSCLIGWTLWVVSRRMRDPVLELRS